MKTIKLASVILLGPLFVVALILCQPQPPPTGAAGVPESARLVTLLDATDVTSGETGFTGPWIYDLQNYENATLVLSVSNKLMPAAETLDLYVQYSPDAGSAVDDIAHFTQIISTTVNTGTYVMYLARGAAGVADRAVDDAATLAANSVRNVSWGDRVRIKGVAANFETGDYITFTVKGYFQ